jgi:hypothetical protein
MTVGILMLHCGLGIRNTNTFYTFRCPQLYLCKKCKLERNMTLCGDNWLYEKASLKKSGSSLLNSARKQWCQCLCNIKIKFKCENKDISVQQICFKFSWRIQVLYQRVSVIFCLHYQCLLPHINIKTYIEPFRFWQSMIGNGNVPTNFT